MAKFYTALEPTLRDFIAQQTLFFTATAPITGRINISPKGRDSLRIVDDRTLVYLDITGSGNETAAHLQENGRLTVMFCSFGDKPLILRAYGRGEVINIRHDAWPTLLSLFPPTPGLRQIMRLHIESVQTSCGYGVPLFNYAGERDTYERWAEKKGAAGLKAYQEEKNRISIDGLPTGLVPPGEKG